MLHIRVDFGDVSNDAAKYYFANLGTRMHQMFGILSISIEALLEIDVCYGHAANIFAKFKQML